MPYRCTRRPPGRPRVDPLVEVIADRERRAEASTAIARHHQAIADSMIAAELASGKTYRQLAAETGTTPGHLRAAKRRFERRKAGSKTA
jgi:hypothetical protein